MKIVAWARHWPDGFLIAAKCNLIISGDKHLLTSSGYGGVRVLKPREFTDKYLSGL